MAYLSKENTNFVTFMNRKYQRYKVNFKYFDDYILWLYYYLCKNDEVAYYRKLEDDLWEYSDWQTGSPRENELKSTGDKWKELEEDRFGLLKDDNYLKYLREVAWKSGLEKRTEEKTRKNKN